MTSKLIEVKVLTYEICSECGKDKGVTVDVYDTSISVVCAYCGCHLKSECQLVLPYGNTGVKDTRRK